MPTASAAAFALSCWARWRISCAMSLTVPKRSSAGAVAQVISLDQQEAEEHVLHAAAEGLTPERLFEKRWASRLIEVVLERLRTEFVADGQADLFDRLEPHLWGDATSVPYA